jgi:hypothetical protein
MSQKEITEAEIRIIRWGEKILTPLLVAGFVGVIGYLANVGNVVAQLQSDHKNYDSQNGDINITVDQVRAEQQKILRSHHALEINLQRLDTSQSYIKEEVKDIKQQNAEILRILRENGVSK